MLFKKGDSMPPKIKVTKENLIEAAFEIVRESSASSLNARNLASKLKCSTQPIFSNFSSMEEVKTAVIEKSLNIYNDFTKQELEKKIYPPYKSSGMAYIRLAKEEPEIFKLLYMRDRTNEKVLNDSEMAKDVLEIIMSSLNLSREKAELFHLEMWSFVHGIASMLATKYLDLDMDLVSDMLTDIYQGLIKQYKE